MSPKAKPIMAALASLAVLLSAGLALACPSLGEHTASTSTNGTADSSGTSSGG
jgi:hypothetical protein